MQDKAAASLCLKPVILRLSSAALFTIACEHGSSLRAFLSVLGRFADRMNQKTVAMLFLNRLTTTVVIIGIREPCFFINFIGSGCLFKREALRPEGSC